MMLEENAQFFGARYVERVQTCEVLMTTSCGLPESLRERMAARVNKDMATTDERDSGRLDDKKARNVLGTQRSIWSDYRGRSKRQDKQQES